MWWYIPTNRKCYYHLSLSNDNKELSVEPKSVGAASQVECMRGDFVRRSDGSALARQRTITFANGDTYDGEASQGQPNGTGTYTWASGGKYIGSFAGGKRNGQGILYWGGKISKGNWKDDKLNGDGEIDFADGSVLKGNFCQ